LGVEGDGPAPEGAADVAQEGTLQAEVEEADGEAEVGPDLHGSILARGHAQGDLRQADELLDPERPAHLFRPGSVLEVGDGVEVPPLGFEREVELEEAHAQALVEDGEGNEALPVEEVGGVPEAAGAPADRLAPRGHEEAAIDVEFDPELVERDVRAGLLEGEGLVDRIVLLEEGVGRPTSDE